LQPKELLPRTESVDPNRTKFLTLILVPKLMKSNTEIELPKRQNERTDKLLETWTKSIVETADPRRAYDRMLMDEPMCK
jgi:IS1 family transposase